MAAPASRDISALTAQAVCSAAPRWSREWPLWAEQFKAQQPEAIQKAMAEEQARIQEEGPDRAKRIRDRLKDVMHLLRPRKVRTTPGGTRHGTSPTMTGPGD